MFKTKDNVEAYEGMWVIDDAGAYEVKFIGSTLIDVQEMAINDDGTYTPFGTCRRLTAREFGTLKYC